ncbi:MAG: PD-(D/E)XK nuclease family protein [Halanaerobiaceae bacterium]|nr:PD-(D/E)XK nuclease family protein [Halanaerobiaceae bacterium]
MVRKLDDLYFSQLALRYFEKCHLKFRRRYLDGLFWAGDWGGNIELKELLERGKLFHQLAWRYYSTGEAMEQELLSGDLKDWFENLKEFRPYNPEDSFYPEYELRVNKEGIKLVAKFDLIYIDEKKRKIIIYDWKTDRKPFAADIDYRYNLQSRVYLYVLQEALDRFLPQENLEPVLIYWNPRFPQEQKTVFYSKKRFMEDKLYLQEKIGEIKGLSYEEFRAVDDERICMYCEYRSICFQKKPLLLEIEEDDFDLDLDWERIEEIEF